jgi:hypothetical protein
MNPENKPSKKPHYGPYEGYESRCRRRLQDDLGMDDASAEAVLHLRTQVIELQNQIRQLEVELAAHIAGQELRLSLYRNIYYEATWAEISDKK